MASIEVAQMLTLPPQQGSFFVLLAASGWRPAYWTIATGSPLIWASHRAFGSKGLCVFYSTYEDAHAFQELQQRARSDALTRIR